MARTLINLPKTPRRGDVIDVQTTIAHPMETGFRPDADGKLLPRDILRRLTCRYNGDIVFSAELFSAVSANPYVAFSLTATASGSLVFSWEGDNGFAQTETVAITVT